MSPGWLPSAVYTLREVLPVHVHEEHRRIAEAIIARDEAVAELLMRRHIADAREALVASLDAG